MCQILTSKDDPRAERIKLSCRRNTSGSIFNHIETYISSQLGSSAFLSDILHFNDYPFKLHQLFSTHLNLGLATAPRNRVKTNYMQACDINALSSSNFSFFFEENKNAKTVIDVIKALEGLTL